MKETSGGSPGAVEVPTLSSAIRLDKGMDPPGGGKGAFLPERNVGNDLDRSIRCPSGGGCCCRPLDVT